MSTLIPELTSPLSPISPWPPPDQPSISNHQSTLPSSTEIYALIAVLGTYILFGLYLSWAFLPVNWLEKIGWSWFPSQEWAIVVPCWMMLCVLLTYWSYAALMAYNTPPFDSLRSFTDPFAKIPPKSSSPEDSFAEEAVDLPIDLVNRILYPPRPRPTTSRSSTKHR